MEQVKYPSGMTFSKNGKTWTIVGYTYYSSCGLYYLLANEEGTPVEYPREEVDEFMGKQEPKYA